MSKKLLVILVFIVSILACRVSIYQGQVTSCSSLDDFGYELYFSSKEGDCLYYGDIVLVHLGIEGLFDNNPPSRDEVIYSEVRIESKYQIVGALSCTILEGSISSSSFDGDLLEINWQGSADEAKLSTVSGLCELGDRNGSYLFEMNVDDIIKDIIWEFRKDSNESQQSEA